VGIILVKKEKKGAKKVIM